MGLGVINNPFPAMARSIKRKQRDELKSLADTAYRLAADNAKRKIGGNLGNKIAATIQKQIFPAYASIVVTHKLARHKDKGGTIRAKNKLLAIPISEESRKRSPSFFPNLFSFRSRKGNLILAEKDGKGVKLLFVLKKSVKQKGLKWFPTIKDIRRAHGIT